MPIQVTIVTQERELFSGEAESVLIPGVVGEMGVLPRHAPLLSLLTSGELIVRKKDGTEEIFAVHGGVVEVMPESVIVLADVAERSDEIDIDRAERARRRAEKMLKEGPPPDPGEAAAFEAALRRAEVRIKVARRMRPHRESQILRTGGDED